MGLTYRPATVKEALRWCRSVHRRLPKLQGARWAVAAERDGAMVGFALVGAPARLLDDGVTLAVTRVAVLEGDASATGNKGACSMLYAACSRAARDMGALDLLTYVHNDEPGTSLRAAGWIKDVDHVSRGGEYSRPSRPRAAAVDPAPKIRWLAPWSRLAQKYCPLCKASCHHVADIDLTTEHNDHVCHCEACNVRDERAEDGECWSSGSHVAWCRIATPPASRPPGPGTPGGGPR